MWVHCTREELAGQIEASDAGTYAHLMRGSCLCGHVHGTGVNVGVSGAVVATYPYLDEGGRLLFEVQRKVGKRFSQRKPDGAGGWDYKLNGVRRVIYRLPELMAADVSKTVYVCEGEKDVDRLYAIGEVATCNPMGAGKWGVVADVAKTALQGRTIVIISDADDEGRKHARQVEASLAGVARSVRVTEPPTPHKDVSNLLDAGGSLDELVAWDVAPIDDGPWKILTVADLSEELPPVPWVCERLGLAPGAVSMSAGYGYSRKTMAWQSAGLAVAAGKPIWGLHGARKGPFVHLDYEQGRRLTQDRYQRLARGMGFDLRDLDQGALKVVAMPEVYLDEKRAADALIRLLDGATFALVDSLRAAFPNADENSSEVRAHLDVISRVSERTGCAVMTIHHARKPNKENADGATFAIRGSSALFDACQSVYVFIGAKETPTTVHHEKDRIRGAAVEDFGLDSVDDVGPNGEPRWGLRVVHLETRQMEQMATRTEEVKAERSALRASDAIVSLLKKTNGRFRGGMTAMRSLAGVQMTSFSKALHDLQQQGRVVREGSYKEPEWRLVES